MCYFSQPLERAPVQVSSAPEEPAGASGSSEPTNAESEDFEVRGSRFSKSADERQRMLLQRKEELLQRARRSASAHYWSLSHHLHEVQEPRFKVFLILL